MIQFLAIPSLVVTAAVSVPMVVFLTECVAALKRPPRRALEADPLARPRLAVIVPAHNEEAGLAATLQAIRGQMVAGDRVVVVADNCTDRTAELARAAGAECVERCDDARRGKGFALAAGMDALRGDQPAVVVVIDADCRVEPRSLGRLAAAAAATNAPVQCINLLRPDPDGTPLSKLSNFAFLVKNLVRQRGMMVLGQPAHLQGTGMAFPWMVIDSVQLATGSITEDLVVGLDLLERGHSPRFCDSARVTSAQASPTAERAQRIRWEHGYLATMIRRMPRLFRLGLLGRPELLGTAADLTVPPLSLLMLLYLGALGVVGVSLASALLVVGGSFPVMTACLAWLGLLGLAFAAVIVVVCRVFARDRMPVSTLLAVPLYAMGKLPIYLGFLCSPQTRWVRAERPDAAPAGLAPEPTAASAQPARPAVATKSGSVA